MNIYEKSAAEIMKRGDRIVAEKKRKAAIVKKISLCASCLCTLVIGFGIWHGQAVKDAYESVKLSGNDKMIVSESDNSVGECVTTTTTASEHSSVITTETESRINNDTTTIITTTDLYTCTTQVTKAEPLQTTAVSVDAGMLLQTYKAEHETVTQPVNTTVSSTAVHITTAKTTAVTTQTSLPEMTVTTTVTTVTPIDENEHLLHFTETESGIMYTKIISFESDELIDSFIKSESVVGYSEITETEKSAELELYTLDSISTEAMIGVKYVGQDDIILYRNVSYRPDLLEDMVEDLGLKRYLTFISTDWYDLKYTEMMNCSFTEEDIWENLFDDVYAERVNSSLAAETESTQMLSITCQASDIMPFDAKIEIRDNGYLLIKLMGCETAFYVGEETALKFIVCIKYNFFSWL